MMKHGPTIHRILLGILLATLPATLPLGAAERGTEELLQRADRALDAGFPHAVVVSLREAAADRLLDASTRTRVLERLARAEIAAGHPEQALAALAGEDSEGRIDFWQGQALLAAGELEAAAEAFLRQAERPQAPLREESLLGAGRALLGAGQTSRAQSLLETIPPNSQAFPRAIVERSAAAMVNGDAAGAEAILAQLKEVPPPLQARHAYLKAWARMQQDDPSGALLAIGSLPREKTAIGERAVVLQAECLARLGRSEEAEEALESYLRAATGKAPRGLAFAKLDELYRAQENPALAELRRLAGDDTNPGRALEAKYFQARAEARAGRPEEAARLLRALLGGDAPADLERMARLDLARIMLETGHGQQAAEILEPLDADPDARFLLGRILHAAGDHPGAAQAFAGAATGSGAPAPEALFNAAVSSFLAGDPPGRNPYLDQLAASRVGGDLEARFRLLAALKAARDRNPEAGRQLEDLVPVLGRSASTPLAEWHFVHLENDRARQALEMDSGATPDDRRKLLEIFLDAEEDPDQTVAEQRARRFLENFPDSPHAAEVRMKLGGIAFDRGDFLAAAEIFETVARANPDSAIGTVAWFMAGRASAQLMTPDALDRAILFFEEAARAGSEDELRARLEQALIVSAQGEFAEALVLLDRVIANSKDPELRAAAWIEKGDTHFAMGVDDPESYQQAAETWEALANEPGLAPHWRDQALTKRGVALQKSGDEEGALESFFAVFLSREEAAPGDFWFFRSGFDAATLLEKRQSWREAIAVYDRMAGQEGPRSAEAKIRANRLRLENFLWEE